MKNRHHTLYLLLLLTACSTSTVQQPETATLLKGELVNWQHFRGDQHSTQYSALSQINRENVAQLQPAWTYQCGDIRPNSNIECNPIVIDSLLIMTTPTLRLVAVHAKTGTEIWRFDPFDGEDYFAKLAHKGVNRGVTFYENGNRIFFGAGPKIYAVDIRTGKLQTDFGENGAIDLRQKLGLNPEAVDIWSTTPGRIYKNLLLTTSATGEDVGAAPGHIRAYNADTGELVWIFHTIPQEGELGYDTWQDADFENIGGANAWAGLSVDEERGIAFFATGSATFDFYGGNRKGDNLFANCVLALDAETGEYVWHFQTIHHDVWDWDLPCAPNLVTVQHDGQPKDAVAQVTKQGFIFLLDRETGEPLFPVEERPVPVSRVPGEQTSTTQPFPTLPPPLARQGFKKEDLADHTPEVRDSMLRLYEKSKADTFFAPPSEQGTLVLPGTLGGANWSGAAFDPETGWLYVNMNELGNWMKLVPRENDDRLPYKNGGYNRVYGPDGYPGTKPPWGTLSAVDLNSGELKWQKPLGEFEELTKKGMLPTGTSNFGGGIVTSGGLVFIASTMDEKIRAFDKTNGTILWEAQLPAAGYALPTTYELEGKQYLVIAAGGGGKLKTKSGDAYVAFALPDALLSKK